MIIYNFKKFFRNVISLVLILSFILQNSFVSGQIHNFTFSENSLANNINFFSKDLIIGLDTGRVCDYFDKSDSQGKIIIIKDLHCNDEAQKNIYKILDEINKEYPSENFLFDDVLIEGAWSDLKTSNDLKFLKSLPNSFLKDYILEDTFLKDKFSGAEKFVIDNMDKNLLGIENENIYKNNLSYFVNFSEKEEINYLLIKLINKYISLKNTNLYSKDLRKLDKIVVDYKKDKISIVEYLDKLKELIVFFDFYKEAPNLMKSYEYNKKLTSLNHRDIMVQALTTERILFPKLSRKEFIKIYELRNNKNDYTEYYLYLQKLVKKNHYDVFLDRNLNSLFSYFDYLNKLNSLDVNAMYSEENRIIYRIGNILSKNDEEKKFIKLGRILSLFYKLINNNAITNEVEEINDNFDEYLNIFKNFLSKNIKDYISFSMIMDIYKNLEKKLYDMKNFYKFAEKRNTIFANNIQNILEKKENSTNKIVILPVVVGGYHASGIADILKEKEIPYIIVSPNASFSQNSNVYNKRLSSQNISNLWQDFSTLALVTHFEGHLYTEPEIEEKFKNMTKEDKQKLVTNFKEFLIKDKDIDWNKDIEEIKRTLANKFKNQKGILSLAEKVAVSFKSLIDKKIKEDKESNTKDEEKKAKDLVSKMSFDDVLKKNNKDLNSDEKEFLDKYDKKIKDLEKSKKENIKLGKDKDTNDDINNNFKEIKDAFQIFFIDLVYKSSINENMLKKFDNLKITKNAETILEDLKKNLDDNVDISEEKILLILGMNQNEIKDNIYAKTFVSFFTKSWQKLKNLIKKNETIYNKNLSFLEIIKKCFEKETKIDSKYRDDMFSIRANDLGKNVFAKANEKEKKEIDLKKLTKEISENMKNFVEKNNIDLDTFLEDYNTINLSGMNEKIFDVLDNTDEILKQKDNFLNDSKDNVKKILFRGIEIDDEKYDHIFNLIKEVFKKTNDDFKNIFKNFTLKDLLLLELDCKLRLKEKINRDARNNIRKSLGIDFLEEERGAFFSDLLNKKSKKLDEKTKKQIEEKVKNDIEKEYKKFLSDKFKKVLDKIKKDKNLFNEYKNSKKEYDNLKKIEQKHKNIEYNKAKNLDIKDIIKKDRNEKEKNEKEKKVLDELNIKSILKEDEKKENNIKKYNLYNETDNVSKVVIDFLIKADYIEKNFKVETKNIITDLKENIRTLNLEIKNIDDEEFKGFIKLENELYFRKNLDIFFNFMNDEDKRQVLTVLKEMENKNSIKKTDLNLGQEEIADQDLNLSKINTDVLSKFLLPAICLVNINKKNITISQKTIFLKSIKENLKKTANRNNFSGSTADELNDTYENKIEVFLDDLLNDLELKKYNINQKKLDKFFDDVLLKNFKKDDIMIENIITKMKSLALDIDTEKLEKILNFLETDLKMIFLLEQVEVKNLLSFFEKLENLSEDERNDIREYINLYINEEKKFKEKGLTEEEIKDNKEKYDEYKKNVEEKRKKLEKECLDIYSQIEEYENIVIENLNENNSQIRANIINLREKAILKTKEIYELDLEIEDVNLLLKDIGKIDKNLSILEENRKNLKGISENIIKEEEISNLKEKIKKLEFDIKEEEIIEEDSGLEDILLKDASKAILEVEKHFTKENYEDALNKLNKFNEIVKEGDLKLKSRYLELKRRLNVLAYDMNKITFDRLQEELFEINRDLKEIRAKIVEKSDNENLKKLNKELETKEALKLEYKKNLEEGETESLVNSKIEILKLKLKEEQEKEIKSLEEEKASIENKHKKDLVIAKTELLCVLSDEIEKLSEFEGMNEKETIELQEIKKDLSEKIPHSLIDKSKNLRKMQKEKETISEKIEKKHDIKEDEELNKSMDEINKSINDSISEIHSEMDELSKNDSIKKYRKELEELLKKKQSELMSIDVGDKKNKHKFKMLSDEIKILKEDINDELKMIITQTNEKLEKFLNQKFQLANLIAEYRQEFNNFFKGKDISEGKKKELEEYNKEINYILLNKERLGFSKTLKDFYNKIKEIEETMKFSFNKKDYLFRENIYLNIQIRLFYIERLNDYSVLQSIKAIDKKIEDAKSKTFDINEIEENKKYLQNIIDQINKNLDKERGDKDKNGIKKNGKSSKIKLIEDNIEKLYKELLVDNEDKLKKEKELANKNGEKSGIEAKIKEIGKKKDENIKKQEEKIKKKEEIKKSLTDIYTQFNNIMKTKEEGEKEIKLNEEEIKNRNNFLENLKKLNDELKKLKDELINKENERIDISAEIINLEKQKGLYGEQIKNIEEEINKLEDELKNLNDDFDRLDRQKKIKDKVASLEKLKDKKEEIIKLIEEKTKEKDSMEDIDEKELEKLKKEYEGQDDLLNNSLKEKNEVEKDLKDSENALKGKRSILEIEEDIKKWQKDLEEYENLFVNFQGNDTEREQFLNTLLTDFQDVYDYYTPFIMKLEKKYKEHSGNYDEMNVYEYFYVFNTILKEYNSKKEGNIISEKDQNYLLEELKKDNMDIEKIRALYKLFYQYEKQMSSKDNLEFFRLRENFKLHKNLNKIRGFEDTTNEKKFNNFYVKKILGEIKFVYPIFVDLYEDMRNCLEKLKKYKDKYKIKLWEKFNIDDIIENGKNAKEMIEKYTREKEEISALKKKLIESKDKVKTLEGKISQVSKTKKELETNIEKIEKQRNKIKNLDEEITKLKDSQTKIEKNIKDFNLNEDEQKILKEEINEDILNSKKKDLEEQIGILKKQLIEKQKERNEILYNIDKNNELLKKVEEDISKLNKKIKEFEEQINKLKGSFNNDKKDEDNKKNIENIENKLKEEEKKEKELDNKKFLLEQELKDIDNELNNLSLEEKDLDEKITKNKDYNNKTDEEIEKIKMDLEEKNLKIYHTKSKIEKDVISLNRAHRYVFQQEKDLENKQNLMNIILEIEKNKEKLLSLEKIKKLEEDEKKLKEDIDEIDKDIKDLKEQEKNKENKKNKIEEEIKNEIKGEEEKKEKRTDGARMKLDLALDMIRLGVFEQDIKIYRKNMYRGFLNATVSKTTNLIDEENLEDKSEDIKAAIMGDVDDELFSMKSKTKYGMNEIFENAKIALKELINTSIPSLKSILERIHSIRLGDYGVVSKGVFEIVSKSVGDDITIRITENMESLLLFLGEKGLNIKEIYKEIFMHEILELVIQKNGILGQKEAHDLAFGRLGILQRLVSNLANKRTYDEMAVLLRNNGINVTGEEIREGMAKYMNFDLDDEKKQYLLDMVNEKLNKNQDLEKMDPSKLELDNMKKEKINNTLALNRIQAHNDLENIGIYSLDKYQETNNFYPFPDKIKIKFKRNIIENIKVNMKKLGFEEKLDDIKLFITKYSSDEDLITYKNGVWSIAKSNMDLINFMQYLTNDSYVADLTSDLLERDKKLKELKKELSKFYSFEEQKFLVDLKSIENNNNFIYKDIVSLYKRFQEYQAFENNKDNLSSKDEALYNIRKQEFDKKNFDILLENAMYDIVKNNVSLQNEKFTKYNKILDYIRIINDMKKNKRFFDIGYIEDFYNYIRTEDLSFLFGDSDMNYQSKVDILARFNELMNYMLEDEKEEIEHESKEIIIDIAGVENVNIKEFISKKLEMNGIYKEEDFLNKNIVIRGDTPELVGDNDEKSKAAFSQIISLSDRIVKLGGKITYIPSFELINKIINKKSGQDFWQGMVRQGYLKISHYFPNVRGIVMSPGTIVDQKILDLAESIYGKEKFINKEKLVNELLNMEFKIRMNIKAPDNIMEALGISYSQDLFNGIFEIFNNQEYSQKTIEAILKENKIRQFVLINGNIEKCKLFANINPSIYENTVEIVSSSFDKEINVIKFGDDGKLNINLLDEEEVEIIPCISTDLEGITKKEKIIMDIKYTVNKFYRKYIRSMIKELFPKIKQNDYKNNEVLYQKEMLRGMMASA